MKIISGGQTGVDRAALDAALSLGVDCGGWCPEGRLAETGTIPEHYPLCELPGGGYFELTSTRDLVSTFTRVADELHHQYALGFTPEKLDGKMHDLTVRVPMTELVVRARKRYLASKASGTP